MHKKIQFIRQGQVVTLENIPPERTLLELLREDMACTGTKEGCGEGDCGACTVVLGSQENGSLRLRAINSCIRLAHSINGMALWTIEDIATPDSPLHPAQQAMLACNASQCGFCTPGFVMSLFSMYHNHVIQGKPITRSMAQEDLSGNLCRCTGYKPIIEAAQSMGALPCITLDESDLLQKIEHITTKSIELEDIYSYKSPQTLETLLRARAEHPSAQIVAGCTDVGLSVTKQHRQFDQILDVTRVQELRRIHYEHNHIAIGAAVPLSDAFEALVAGWPQLHTFVTRFAGLLVRNSGTLGGNVPNGSPIGDSKPLLIALHAHVVLMSLRGAREMPLEQLYTGYRQNVMAPDEILAWIKIPKPGESDGSHGLGESGKPAELLEVYKISKRFDDDISAVCLAINLHIDKGIVVKAFIGAGGVAATPVRAVKTEAALRGKPWTADTVQQAMTTLRAEFSPISDMRASSGYRIKVLGNLLQRYWLESQGLKQINLQSFKLEEAL